MMTGKNIQNAITTTTLLYNIGLYAQIVKILDNGDYRIDGLYIIIRVLSNKDSNPHKLGGGG
jgi:hypothetical protein